MGGKKTENLISFDDPSKEKGGSMLDNSGQREAFNELFGKSTTLKTSKSKIEPSGSEEAFVEIKYSSGEHEIIASGKGTAGGGQNESSVEKNEQSQDYEDYSDADYILPSDFQKKLNGSFGLSRSKLLDQINEQIKNKDDYHEWDYHEWIAVFSSIGPDLMFGYESISENELKSRPELERAVKKAEKAVSLAVKGVGSKYIDTLQMLSGKGAEKFLGPKDKDSSNHKELIFRIMAHAYTKMSEEKSNKQEMKELEAVLRDFNRYYRKTFEAPGIKNMFCRLGYAIDGTSSDIMFDKVQGYINDKGGNSSYHFNNNALNKKQEMLDIVAIIGFVSLFITTVVGTSLSIAGAIKSKLAHNTMKNILKSPRYNFGSVLKNYSKDIAFAKHLAKSGMIVTLVCAVLAVGAGIAYAAIYNNIEEKKDKRALEKLSSDIKQSQKSR